MGDILSQEEVVERHETAEKLYRERLEEELVKPEQRLSPQDLVGMVRRSDLLCERVIDVCRTPEFGFRGRNLLYALLHVGVAAFQRVIRQALDADEETQNKIDDELERHARREVEGLLSQIRAAEAAPFRDRTLNTQELEELRRIYQGVERQGRLVPAMTRYDFKHPARVNKDQLRTLENLHDNFARLLRPTFSGVEVGGGNRDDSRVFVPADNRQKVATAVADVGGADLAGKPFAQQELLEAVRVNL
jgi:hypothetical protein